MENLPSEFKKKINIRNMVLMALLTAITVIFTLAIRIPTVITGGYINTGDIIVIFSGYIMGGKRGALIGALGSSLADLLGGYPLFAPITFIAKGGEGFLSGFIGKDLNPHAKIFLLLTGGLLSGFWMVLCYFLGEKIFLGPAKAITAVGPNIMQALTGIFCALILYRLIGRKLSN